MEDRIKALEEQAKTIKIDLDILWECYFSWEGKVIEFGSNLEDYVNELTDVVNKHNKEDFYFKKELSETHKRYYEKFEALFGIIKASKKKAKYTIK